MSETLTYKDAGVDTKEGERAVSLMKEYVKKTVTPGVLTGIGGFGSLYKPNIDGMKAPVLVAGTDGVGTKLKIAILMDKHDTVGVDLVAMCVNDVLCQGARPLFFLDYIATSRVSAEKIAELVKGVADGCALSGCALVGGETAEMPGFYGADDYDMAGFAVGMVDEAEIIDGSRVAAGDVIIGLPSSGIHSNGYSLVRKVFFEIAGLTVNDRADGLDGTLGETLLTPTRIYAKPITALLSRTGTGEPGAGRPTGMLHITGGGFYENIPRILPEGLGVEIDTDAWTRPPIFDAIMRYGNVAERDMFAAFNMGVGFMIVTRRADADATLSILKEQGEDARIIGSVVPGEGVRLTGIDSGSGASNRPGATDLTGVTDRPGAKKFNISVLVSGNGSNLQALMDGIAGGAAPNARVGLVLSSNPDAFALERASKAGVKTAVADAATFPGEAERAAEILRLLAAAETDLVVLAGYMSILPPEIVNAYRGRIVNIHPSLIPKHCGKGYYGKRVHRSVLDAGDAESGATVHFVDEGVDTGEIILQKKVPVLPGDTEETLASRVLETEHGLIVEAVARLCAGGL
jgi:formyltetrahydrofolate-dependent phosphoribosylglycinamide formyltransferase